ncbi:hypothetical protein FOZ63_032362 [Perkinsus olseni]|uniref:Lysophosphatidylcholine acyltransferase 2 n=1 Tax=Perkinsus olseni TaxID=32597 RepID=A0A7J6RS88_PEROL|nr:hypothetical protein FOZ63_032362 [Perkinsus olseni]
MEKYTAFADPSSGVNPFIPFWLANPPRDSKGVKLLRPLLLCLPLVVLRLPFLILGMLLLAVSQLLVTVFTLLSAPVGRGLACLLYPVSAKLVLLGVGVVRYHKDLADSRRLKIRPIVDPASFGSSDIILSNYQSLTDVLLLLACWAPREFIFVNSAGQARILGPIGALLEACSKNPGQWGPQVAGLPDAEQILDEGAGPYVIFAEGARTNGTGILRFPKKVDAFVEAARKSERLGAAGIHYSSKNNCGHYSPSHTLPIPGALHTLYQMAQLYQPATVTWLPCKDTKASTAIQTTTLLSRLVGRECVDMSEKVDARTAEAFRNYYSQYSVVSKKAE